MVAHWSQSGNHIAFVKDRDLYILYNLKQEVRITSDASGNPDVFNGVPDWVYEEEVFSANFAFWFSPDGKKLAFLRFNESDVPIYDFPIYNVGIEGFENQYPTHYPLKYPKPGTPNPTVSLHLVHLDENATGSPVQKFLTFPKFEFPDDKKIVNNVYWTPDSNKLLVKVLNRAQDFMAVVVFDTQKDVASFTHRTETTEGWIEKGPPIFFINNRTYIDTVPKDGYEHLALFDVHSSEPIRFLTQGQWEVVDGVAGYDTGTRRVFFMSTEIDSTERHFYSVNIDGTEKTQLTPRNKPGFYSVTMSPNAQWYLLNYEGPEFPYQAAFSTQDVQFKLIINEYDSLRKTLTRFQLPTINYTRIPVSFDGKMDYLNAKIVYPVGFNASLTKFFPLLVSFYGGPNSQQVQKTFSYGFHEYAASTFHHGTISPFLKQVLQEMGASPQTSLANATLKLRKRDNVPTDPKLLHFLNDFEKQHVKATRQPPFVVLIVDARGTGFRGTAFRHVITGQLGYHEPRDIVDATRRWVAKNAFIDPMKVGAWGWSYGGYLAGKVIECDRNTNDGQHVFNAAVSVAPVTDWRYYDTIYTERYMKLLDGNIEKYQQSSIRDVTSFGHVRYLVLHGTGDDNVHVSNTLNLIDRFTRERSLQPNAYRMHLIADNRHSMSNTPNAYLTTHRLVLDWMTDAWKEVDQEKWRVSRVEEFVRLLRNESVSETTLRMRLEEVERCQKHLILC